MNSSQGISPVVPGPNYGEQYKDSEVIENVLKGDTALFEIIIRRYNPFLHKTGMAFGFNHEDTQDLMQESFVSAYLHLDSFQNRSSLKTWLISIMVRQCIRKKGKRSSQSEITSLIQDNSIPMFSGSQHNDVNKLMINRELNYVIEQALLKMPEDHRIVFLQREVNGLSSAETAEALQISESNVKVRLHRARIMLRKEIEKTYTPEDIFDFNLKFCDLMVDRVMGEIRKA